jgi:hypothetical protein
MKLTSEDEILKWLYDNFDLYRREIKIHPDLTVDVNASLNPSTYNNWKGGLCPVVFGTVTGLVDFSNRGLVSLEGAPKSCRSFICGSNYLKSLEGGPNTVSGAYICSYNELTDLRGAPDQVPKRFVAHGNPLKSLEGCPSFIGERFHLTYTLTLPLLRTLVALDGVVFDVSDDDVDPVLERILDKYKGQGRRGAFACKKEMIEAGFEGNARW